MPPIRKNEYGIDYLNQKKEEKKPFTIGALQAAALGIMVGSAITNHQNKNRIRRRHPRRIKAHQHIRHEP